MLFSYIHWKHSDLINGFVTGRTILIIGLDLLKPLPTKREKNVIKSSQILRLASISVLVHSFPVHFFILVKKFEHRKSRECCWDYWYILRIRIQFKLAKVWLQLFVTVCVSRSLIICWLNKCSHVLFFHIKLKSYNSS
jgi:hypothetical protein